MTTYKKRIRLEPSTSPLRHYVFMDEQVVGRVLSGMATTVFIPMSMEVSLTEDDLLDIVQCMTQLGPHSEESPVQSDTHVSNTDVPGADTKN